MADTLELTKQGARSFPAIPEPTPDPNALVATAFALKRAVETLIALVGGLGSVSIGGSSTGVTDTGKMTQAQVLARISIGV